MDLVHISWQIWSLAIVVYLSQLPPKKLKNFGDFLKKVLGVLPISKVAESIWKRKKLDKE